MREIVASRVGIGIVLMFIACFLSKAVVGTNIKNNTLLSKDAIVVLAGAYQERVFEAAKLFKRRPSSWVLLTNDGVRGRWSEKYQKNLYHVEWAAEELVEQGVPRQLIVQLPFYGSGTIYDALATRRYVVDNGLNIVILVTSDYHIQRALWTFTEVLHHLKVEIDVVSTGGPSPGWRALVLEKIKYIYYVTRFGILGVAPVI